MNIVQTIRNYLLLTKNIPFKLRLQAIFDSLWKMRQKREMRWHYEKLKKLRCGNISRGGFISFILIKKKLRNIMTSGGSIIKQSHAYLAYNIVCIILSCSLRWCTLNTYIYIEAFFGRNFWGSSSRIFSSYNLLDLFIFIENNG